MTAKRDFPVHKVRRYLEPGPIVLVSSRWRGKANIMTMGWHTVMEFTPSLVGCVISGANHSFDMIRNSRRVRHQPADDRADRRRGGHRQLLGRGGRQVREVRADAGDGRAVKAPLIEECHANFECRLHDDALVDKYNFFIFEVVKAHVAPSPKHPETLHYTGDGVFVVAGRGRDKRALFRPEMLSLD